MGRFLLEVLCGPPTAGKSTWAELAAAGDLVSGDDVRLWGAQGHVALEQAHHAASELLAGGRSVTVDACAMNARRRARWRELAAEHGASTRLVVFDVAPSEAYRRNHRRPIRERVPNLSAYLREWPSERAAAVAEPWGEIVLAAEVRASADEW